jgi:hypothetical protein
MSEEEYKKIYDRICDFLTEKFDADIMELDSLNDKFWLKDEFDIIYKKAVIRKKIHDGSCGMVKKLLKNDINEIKKFYSWLKKYNGDDDDRSSSDWWKVSV